MGFANFCGNPQMILNGNIGKNMFPTVMYLILNTIQDEKWTVSF
jgi:hypothetical protein